MFFKNKKIWIFLSSIILLLIGIFLFLLFSSRVKYETPLKGFIISNSMENGQEIEIIEENNFFYKIKMDENTNKNILKKNILSFNKIFKETNDEIYAKNDLYLYTNISDFFKTNDIIYKGTALNRKYTSSEGYELILYKNEYFYIKSEDITNISLETPINKKMYLLNNSISYENPSLSSRKNEEIKALTPLDIISEIDIFYKIDLNGDYVYIEKEKIVNYEDIFKNIQKDVYNTSIVTIYKEPNLEDAYEVLDFNLRLRVVAESEDLYAIEYDDNICYIKKSKTKDALKIFTQSSDYVITKKKTIIYSLMDDFSQPLYEVEEGDSFLRLYTGKEGYDMVKIDNSIGYIKSNDVEPSTNLTKKTYEVMYVMNDSIIYNGLSTKTNELGDLNPGEKVLRVETSDLGFSKILTEDLSGYVLTENLIEPAKSFFEINELKYAKEDIVFNYIENNQEHSVIIPKNMYVKLIESSYMGLDKIEYSGHIGVISSGLLQDKTSVSTTEEFMSYKSDTLEILINRHDKDTRVYWTCEIKTTNPSRQFGTSLSYGDYGGKRQLTSGQVKDNGGIIGINGSGFWYEDGTTYGNIIIKNSKVIKDGYGEHHLMCLDKYGKLFSAPDPSSAKDLLDLGVTNTFMFGPMLIIDGKNAYDTNMGSDPRTAIGMIKPGHYVLIVADGRRKNYSKGLSLAQMASIFQEYDCEYAYNLDGGGSATLVFMNEVINRPSDGNERPCADGIYFID